MKKKPDDSELAAAKAKALFYETQIEDVKKQRDQARQANVVLQGQLDRARHENSRTALRLDACLYSMVLMQEAVRAASTSSLTTSTQHSFWFDEATKKWESAQDSLALAT